MLSFSAGGGSLLAAAEGLPPSPACACCASAPCLQDIVHVSFESIIDLSEFSLRIPQADAEKLPDILQAVPQAQREEMQRALGRVWQKYTYSSYLPYARRFREIQQENAAVGAAGAGAPDTVQGLDPTADDAFRTLMAWLLHRIPATR